MTDDDDLMREVDEAARSWARDLAARSRAAFVATHHDRTRPTHLCDDPGGLVPPDEREDGDA